MPAIDIDRDTAHEAAQRELDKPIYPKASLSHTDKTHSSPLQHFHLIP